MIHDEGVIQFDGGEYEGELRDGKAFGEGVFTKDGDTWIGTFLDNQLHGYCKWYGVYWIILGYLTFKDEKKP